MAEVQLRSLWLKLILPILVGTAAVVLWQKLDALMQAHRLAGSTRPEDLAASLQLNPRQPDVHRQLGLFHLYDPAVLDVHRAVDHFQQSVLLSASDFNLWMNLGQAYEQSGEPQKAAAAFQTAVQLAPNSFLPRWINANYLLRHDETDRALAEFVHLADRNPDAIDNICELILQASGGDAEELVRLGKSVGSDQSRRRIGQFLLRFGHLEQSIALWQPMMPPPIADFRFQVSDVKTHSLSNPQSAIRNPQSEGPVWKLMGDEILATLLSARDFNRAYSIWQQMLEAEGQPHDELFYDGDFELNGTVTSPGFNWQITAADGVQAMISDLESKSGNRSLMLDFRKHERVSYAGVSHYLKVDPDREYRLSFSYKTRDMVAGNRVFVELVDTEDSRRLNLSSEQLGTESQWTEKQITFRTPPETRWLALRVVRRPSDSLYDFVKGRIWFDAFKLSEESNSR